MSDKKTERYQMHLQDKPRWMELAKFEGGDLSKLIHQALGEYAETHGLEGKVKNVMESINNVIHEIEITRDYMKDNIISIDQRELYMLINFCYDILAMSDYVSKIRVPIPDEMRDDEFSNMKDMNKYSPVIEKYAVEVYKKVKETHKKYGW
jgi:hypothetical protein